MRFFRKRKRDTSQEEAEKLMGLLQCECTLWTEGSKLEELQESYERVRKLGKAEGFTPVFIVPDKNLLKDITRSPFEGTLLSGLNNGKEVLEQFWNSHDCAKTMEICIKNKYPEPLGHTLDSLLEQYADNQRLSEISLILAKIPIRHPWEVFVKLPIGGWNTCPAPKELVAISRYWYEVYGVIPVVIGSDTVEFYLEYPVLDRYDAEQLAKEHFAFCEDKVYQEMENASIVELANTIMGSSVWHFWWD